jgi:uncharacterized Zn-binding protein involved in type VI secretion
MGAGIVRVGDLSTAHGCFPERPAVQGSTNVFVNGKGVVRLGDLWATHCCTTDPSQCHDGVSSGASSSVFVNGQPVVRVGDPISCGSVAMQGSDNVLSG